MQGLAPGREQKPKVRPCVWLRSRCPLCRSSPCRMSEIKGRTWAFRKSRFLVTLPWRSANPCSERGARVCEGIIAYEYS